MAVIVISRAFFKKGVLDSQQLPKNRSLINNYTDIVLFSLYDNFHNWKKTIFKERNINISFVLDRTKLSTVLLCIHSVNGTKIMSRDNQIPGPPYLQQLAY